jgi:glutamate/aspartate transport system ATP-binding protein
MESSMIKALVPASRASADEMMPLTQAPAPDPGPGIPMIEISGLCKSYGELEVLKNCNLVVDRGEVVVICGPSGSGKSTLIKCVNGLEPFDRGSLTVDGVAVGGRVSDMTKLRARIGMVFQHFELYPHLTVLQNICLAPVHVLKRSKADAQAKARALLARVRLPDKEGAYPAQLSGGQQQRIAIARSLAMDPVAMLFDEPTSALDPEMIEVRSSRPRRRSSSLMPRAQSARSYSFPVSSLTERVQA